MYTLGSGPSLSLVDKVGEIDAHGPQGAHDVVPLVAILALEEIEFSRGRATYIFLGTVMYGYIAIRSMH